MRLELAERLVCPMPHARTPLIVVADATADRDLLRGTAGCMTCYREAHFTEASLVFPGAAATAVQAVPSDEALLERLEALLGITEPGLPLLFTAHYAEAAREIARRHEAPIAVLGAAGPSPFGVGHVRNHGDAVPFSDATFAAAAIGDEASPALLADAVRCVSVGGRVLAPVGLAVPLQVQELARDASQWVGTVTAASPIVPLRRA